MFNGIDELLHPGTFGCRSHRPQYELQHRRWLGTRKQQQQLFSYTAVFEILQDEASNTSKEAAKEKGDQRQ